MWSDMDVRIVQADLEAEQSALDRIVAPLDHAAWLLPTASTGWSVADQIGHLAYFDGSAARAITDPEGFAGEVRALVSALGEGSDAADELTLGPFRRMRPPELMSTWRARRGRLSDAAAQLGDDTRVVWYGPSMGSASFLTARLMECWAHGHDIVGAVGAQRPATDRIRHIAQLGFITRGWSYKNRGLEVPAADVRVELTSPTGAVWRFGPEGAGEYVHGSAEEFCLVVTQRRNVHETDLAATPIALDWLEKAQAFAGPPTTM
jgi:uncharacterized protein (TIGR03084 family)